MTAHHCPVCGRALSTEARLVVTPAGETEMSLHRACAKRLVASILEALHPEVAAPHRWRPRLGKPLSEREQQVLTLVVQGKTNREIAQRLGVTNATVRNQIYMLMTKLGVRSRTEAAVVAVRERLVK